MMIEMFLSNSNNKKLWLLREFINNNEITLTELSKITGIFENSISKYINNLNADFNTAGVGAVIQKNRQHQYHLETNNISELVVYSKISYFYGENSALFKLCRLIVSEVSITVDQVCEALYISKPYVYKNIAMMNELLEKYSIQMKIDKAYCLRFHGNELNIRIFLFNFFSQCIPSDVWIASYASKEEILSNIELQSYETKKNFDYFEKKKLIAFWQMMKYRLISKNYLPTISEEHKNMFEFYCFLSKDWIKRVFPHSKVMAKKIFETEYLYLNFFLRIFISSLIDRQSMMVLGKK